MKTLPILLKDGYKVDHRRQYAPGTTAVFSNLTPRASRDPRFKEVMLFGLQYCIKKYLVEDFSTNFFNVPVDQIISRYKRRIKSYFGVQDFDTGHIESLHALGYLPLEIRAVPEGTFVPLRVPMFTVRNTNKEFFWLTNMVETLISNIVWMPCTSATIAFEYLKGFHKAANQTDGSKDFIKWQGHDFSFRGMSGVESACLSGAAHLLSFAGTDTLPAIDLLEQYYHANSDEELVGGSVPATEHSCMCSYGQENERDSIRHLIETVYPNGILSIVCDTWDFWSVITETIPSLKDQILSRNGKVVVRPDSGDPVKIVCGDHEAKVGSPEHKGAIQCLWETFGGTINAKGFKTLNPHIGLIYGDSITLDRQAQIMSGLATKGFASDNVVLGIGSYTYQYNTRDTFGFAIKATHGIINGEGRSFHKTPKTDNGTKNSAKGLVDVIIGDNGRPQLVDQIDQNKWPLGNSILNTVFLNGQASNTQSLSQIRSLVDKQLQQRL